LVANSPASLNLIDRHSRVEYSVEEEFVLGMACQPPCPESIEALRRLQREVTQRGDECLAMLLAGVDLYTTVGREWELPEIMRKFAHDAEEMVRNTPTAAELKKLYEREDGRQQPRIHYRGHQKSAVIVPEGVLGRIASLFPIRIECFGDV
jgi:hypothetical protein